MAAGEASAADLAYLTDRVRVARGEPERLDERRAAVGLEPFADYAAQTRRFTA